MSPTEVLDLPWFHSIKLRDGTVKAAGKPIGVMNREYELAFSRLDVKGKSVADIGAWSGAFSVEAARRGASQVTAVDHVTWRHRVYRGREVFDYVVNDSGFTNIKALDWNLEWPAGLYETMDGHDIVLLLGVFYHLRDPIAALREMAKATREVMVLETHIELDLPDRFPAMRFYPGTELAGDGSCWWGPNAACIVDLLKMVGFVRIEETEGTAPNRRFFHAYKENS